MSAFGDALILGRSEQERLLAENATLRAEIERLRAELADLLPRMDADALRIENLWRKNERLRAHVDELTQILDSHRVWVSDDQLPVWVCQAENQRLKSEVPRIMAQRDDLRAENERLRAALEAIIDKGQTGDYMERAPLVGIALEALGRS